MAAEIELIVGLIPIAKARHQLRFVVAFEAGSGNHVENSVGAVAVIRIIAAALHFEIVDVLGIDLRPEIARDIRIRDRHAVDQPTHLMAAANVELS